jgi:hypothetical protein
MNGRKKIETERKYDTYFDLIKIENKVTIPGKGYTSVIHFNNVITDEDKKKAKTALFEMAYSVNGKVNAIDKRATI